MHILYSQLSEVVTTNKTKEEGTEVKGFSSSGCRNYDAEVKIDDVILTVPILQFLHTYNLHTQTLMRTSAECTLQEGCRVQCKFGTGPM